MPPFPLVTPFTRTSLAKSRRFSFLLLAKRTTPFIALLFSSCANVPVPTEPVTPESILGSYTLTSADKVMTVGVGTSGIVSGKFAGAMGTFTIRKDTFTGSFAIPQEAVADTLSGTYTLTPYPYGAGGYTYTPAGDIARGFAGFTYQADILTVFYRMGNQLPYTTYVLTFGRK